MANLGAGAAGAASGAATGSAFGVPGAVVGGITGGLLGLFGTSKKKKPKKLDTLDPTQKAIYKDYAKALQGGGGQFGDLFNFNPDQLKDVFQKMYADPAYQNYQENIVPGVTGAFRGGNIQNSSYMAGELAKKGRDVQNNLNAHLSQMLYQGQQDAINRRVQGIQNILNTQTFAYQQPQASAGDNAFSSLLDIGGKAMGGIIDRKFGGSGGVPSGGSGAVSGGINPALIGG
jgi:hypothetical protein